MRMLFERFRRVIKSMQKQKDQTIKQSLGPGTRQRSMKITVEDKGLKEKIFGLRKYCKYQTM